MGFANAYSNSNCQILIFWDEAVDCRVVEESEQKVTCSFNWMGTNILITFVYVKCIADFRKDLWENVKNISDRYSLSQYIAGDFDCIVDPVEKQGGSPHRMSKSLSFLQCIMDCDLIDPGYSGSTFTWCNGWQVDKRVWKRLDRILVNMSEPVERAWNVEVQGSPMWRFHLKLKNTCKKLSEWSRSSIGNIFEKVIKMEEKVRELEEKIINDNTDMNRGELNHANSLLIRAYKKEESFWKQKSGVKWFVQGEVNSRFFHSIIKGRKKRLSLKKIRGNDGNWIEGEEEIAKESVFYFQK
ncbi:uncharacterized protein LOC107761696 [Nicotiana tabacum]|uniref:Uncharacterized protein LOC107761696 n=1 Tax=Nicotiana tabacum TaxID=4097 RepID=A0A1S3X685_TOBAC|nr:PREDICTED: uncharacterized protein LOC107761696 [Nicotiana tabacum]